MPRTTVPTKNISKIDDLSCIAKLALRSSSIQISGWTLKGKISNTIALSEIKEATAVPSRTGHNLFLVLSDAVVAVCMKKGSLSMAHLINDRIGNRGMKKDLPAEQQLRRAI